jgi:hypothetical protein
LLGVLQRKKLVPIGPRRHQFSARLFCWLEPLLNKIEIAELPFLPHHRRDRRPLLPQAHSGAR